MGFIDSGTYGCAYRPALACNTNLDGTKNGKPLVGKLFRFVKDMQEELALYDKIKSIDPENKYFPAFYPKDTCVVDRKESEVEDCSLLEDSKQRYFFQLLLEDGGQDLRILDKSKLNNWKLFREKFAEMAEAIEQLLSIQIVHTDIKPANILYDASREKLTLIDFSLLTTTENLFQESFLCGKEVKDTYPYYPPESWWFCALKISEQMEGSPSADPVSIWDLFTKYIEREIRVSEKMLDLFRGSRSKTQFLQFCKKHTRTSDFTEAHAEKMDIWMLGFSMLYLYTRMFPSQDPRKEDVPFWKGILHPNPAQRLTPKQAKEMLRKAKASGNPSPKGRAHPKK